METPKKIDQSSFMNLPVCNEETQKNSIFESQKIRDVTKKFVYNKDCFNPTKKSSYRKMAYEMMVKEKKIIK